MEIITLDLHFQNVTETIAAYLVTGTGGPVLVETGPGSTLPNLREQLSRHGYAPADIQHVLVTHIHLDHAGAAGWWAQQGARVYVHEVGAPHVIDPSRLLMSAKRIYQERMDELWGEILPAPAGQVVPIKDGDVLEIEGLTFTALDTPGHANHHHVFRLGDVAFTGDAAGVHMPGSNFLSLPAPPPEFNREVWQRTIDRLLAEKFTTIYPTHFGPIKEVDAHLQKLRRLLDEATDFVGERMAAGQEREEIMPAYLDWVDERAQDAGVSAKMAQRYEAANPNFMSVDGIMRYWRKKGTFPTESLLKNN